MSTRLRLRSTRATLRSALGCRRALGVSRLASLTEFYDVGIRVVAAVRPGVSEQQNTAVQGKGWTLEQAACGALMEAVERDAAANLVLSEAPTDLSWIEGIERFGFRDFRSARAVGVTRWYDKEVFKMPRAEIAFPFDAVAARACGTRPHTSGLAAGSGLEEALLFGALELVERNASSRLYAGQTRSSVRDVLDLDSITEPKTRALISRLRELEFDLIVLRLRAVAPVFVTFLADTSGFSVRGLKGGQAAHVNAAGAVSESLLESVQSLVVAMQGAREDFARHSDQFTDPGVDARACSYLAMLRANLPTVPLADAEDFSGEVPRECLEELDCRLRAASFGALHYADLTRRELPFAVVKAIVPGLFDSLANPGRGQTC